MGNGVPNMQLGRVDVVKDDAYLGHVMRFVDKDYSDPDSAEVLSSSYVYTAFVKNNSGGTLAPGLGAVYKTSNVGKEVGGLSGANTIVDGVIDPFLTAAVPDGSYFLLIIKGPVDVEVGAGDATAGTIAQTLANGKFADGTPGTNPIGHSGKFAEAASSGSRARLYFNNAFSALQC